MHILMSVNTHMDIYVQVKDFDTWSRSLALLYISCTVLGKLLKHSNPQLLHLWIEIIIVLLLIWLLGKLNLQVVKGGEAGYEDLIQITWLQTWLFHLLAVWP